MDDLQPLTAPISPGATPVGQDGTEDLSSNVSIEDGNDTTPKDMSERAETMSNNSSRRRRRKFQRRPFYYDISPEERKFIVIIRKRANRISLNKFESFFELMWPQVLHFQSLGLRVDRRHPAKWRGNKIWISCLDEETADWVTQVVLLSLKNTCKVESFPSLFKLKKLYTFFPGTKHFSNWREVLKILEKQNPRLSTSKWVATTSFQEVVTAPTSTQNVKVEFLVDAKTLQLLQNQDFKLQFCDWTLTFYGVSNQEVVEI